MNNEQGEERVKTILTYHSDENTLTTYAESLANGEIRGFARKDHKDPAKKIQPMLSVSRV